MGQAQSFPTAAGNKCYSTLDYFQQWTNAHLLSIYTGMFVRLKKGASPV